MYEVRAAAGARRSWPGTAADRTARGRRSSGSSEAPTDDAVLTPIYHALSNGGWRSRQHGSPATAAEPAPSGPAAASTSAAADPVAEFERDPLYAPIPLQSLDEVAPVRALRVATGGGRHRR